MMRPKIAFIWMVNTTERLVGINAALHAISQCKHKDRLDIWIASSTTEIEWKVLAYLRSSPYKDMPIRTVNVNDTTWHGYKKKLASIIGKYEYFIKCDDDLFYGHHVIDCFIENVDLLEDPANLWLFPVSSINSLTTDIFIDDFVEDASIRQAIYHDFTMFDYNQYPNHNGTDDLLPLKAFLSNMGEWDAGALRQYMLDSRYFNGGEHPIRHSNQAITRLNTYIIDHIDRVFAPQDFSIIPYPGFYQAQFYVMRSDAWFHIQGLVDKGIISRGLIDETEINWYAKYNSKIPLMIRHAYVIHPALIGVDLQHYHQVIYHAVQQYIGA
jgi:hypothetical protein